MTKTLCTSIVVLYLFATCQKGLNYTLDDINKKPTYAVSFKANGKNIFYSGTTQASFNAVDSMYSCNISVEVAPSTTADKLTINLLDKAPFTTETKYTSEMISGKPQASIIYSDSLAKQFSSAVTIAPAYVTVMLTENTSGLVAGTFSGVLQNADDIAKGNTTNVIAITEGHFIVKK